MSVRVRYRPGDLYDSIVETFPEANAWEEDDDGNLLLIFEEYDEERDTTRRLKIGKVRRTRWESVIVEDEEEEDDDRT